MLAGQIILAHVVALTEPPGGVRLGATRHPAASAAIEALALGRQTPVAADLLVVSEAQALGNLIAHTTSHATLGTATAILALWRESPVSADLLVVFGAIPGCPRTAPT